MKLIKQLKLSSLYLEDIFDYCENIALYPEIKEISKDGFLYEIEFNQPDVNKDQIIDVFKKEGVQFFIGNNKKNKVSFFICSKEPSTDILLNLANSFAVTIKQIISINK